MAYRHDNVVVCGVDGSDASFNALKWAAQEAKMRNAVLEILCCYQEPTYPGHRGNAGLTEADAQEVIEKANVLVADVGIDVQTSKQADDPTSALLARSKQREADPAVLRIGSLGRSLRLSRHARSVRPSSSRRPPSGMSFPPNISYAEWTARRRLESRWSLL